ncbi:MAG TPA: ribonuclease P protein component [Polyangiaceae bacterium]|nr:ribonuclease P protein component [Polyangiaceae bacterium]
MAPPVTPGGGHVREPRGTFAKRERVRKRREYLEIQAQGRRVNSPHFVLVVRAREPSRDGVVRLGITASRKVGVAVVRSRIRRLIREAFRATRELFPRDADVVVIVKRAPQELRLSDVVLEFQSVQRNLSRRIDEARQALNNKRSEP